MLMSKNENNDISKDSPIVSTKSKDKFLSCLRCPHSNFQSGQILSTPNIALIIFHLNSKHPTFWQDNGSRSNSRICAMFRAFRASSTQPLFFETSKTKPVLVRDPIQ